MSLRSENQEHIAKQTDDGATEETEERGGLTEYAPNGTMIIVDKSKINSPKG